MENGRRRGRTGLLLGAIASAAGLLVATVLAWQGIPFAPASAGQAIVELLPGPISIPLIALLHEWAKRLLELAVAVGFLAAGALAGRRAADERPGTAGAAALAAGPWALAVVLGAAFAASRIDVVGTLIGAAAGAAAQLTTLIWLLSSGATAAPDAGRRRTLLRVAAVAALVAAGGIVLGSRLRAVGTRAAGPLLAARRLRRAATPTPEAPEFARITGLTPRLTAVGDHYVVDSALFKPAVDLAEWRLEIKGAVERPFTLTYDELLDLEAVEQLHTLECISNEVGGDLMGTTRWTGVPVRDLLERAGVRPNAYDVAFRSVDDYVDSIPVAKAMEPQTIVAYLMDGRAVPQEHGFPARVLVPNIYGMKNVKWLRAIEVVTYDLRGYWQERDWSDVAVVNTNTRIDVPTRTVSWGGGPIDVAGVAFAGSRGIAAVELSTDGGATWIAATLEDPVGPLTWRRWRVAWTPPRAGAYRLAARATDGTGRVETAIRREPFPNGATGYDTMDLTVR